MLFKYICYQIIIPSLWYKDQKSFIKFNHLLNVFFFLWELAFCINVSSYKWKKNDEAHIAHAPQLLDNGTHNGWQGMHKIWGPQKKRIDKGHNLQKTSCEYAHPSILLSLTIKIILSLDGPKFLEK